VGRLLTPSKEELDRFQEYKQKALINYEQAQQDGDKDIYNIALKYCNNALKIQRDKELKKMKKKIESQ
jgi:hypothetical protein